MKETIDLLGKILTNILTALYEPFGFSLLLSFLAMFFYLYAYEPQEAGKGWKSAIVTYEAVHAMLAVLTDKQRNLIHQQFVLGKTHQEIADDMGMSRGSVTRAVNQALERIRRKFDFEAHYELAAGGSHERGTPDEQEHTAVRGYYKWFSLYK